MDINLTALLIPYYSGPCVHESNFSEEKYNKCDHRTNKALSIGEFIQAFGIYKNIMSSVYHHRRSELDLYERDIVDMATRYPGGGFYEYHKKFSADAAAHLRYNNKAVDWSIRNNTLFCNIFANVRPNACSICNSTFHSTGFCTQPNNQNFPVLKNNAGFKMSEQDTYGRERIFHRGREICNNFNGGKGCISHKCRNFHVCLLCRGDHSKLACPSSKNDKQAPQKIGALGQKSL